MATRSFTRPMTSTTDQVWTRLTDPQVSQARARAGGAEGRVTRHDVTGDTVVIGIDTLVPESWMPSMVRSRMRGAALPTVRRVETWQNGDVITGTMDLVINGAPGEASCRMYIGPLDGTVTAGYDVSLTVSMPLVGRAIEGAVLPRIMDALAGELDVLDAS